MNIILAAGAQSRWNNSFARATLPSVKQLVLIDGIPLIEDIQAKFKPSVVITRSQKIINHSEMSFKPEANSKLLETLYHTSSLWIEKTTVLLGDVLYGKYTVQRIKDCQQAMFFGDKHEIYAFVFPAHFNDNVSKGCNYLIRTQKQCKLWNLYRHLNLIPQNEHIIQGMFTYVNDCKDFDVKRQYTRWLNARNK